MALPKIWKSETTEFTHKITKHRNRYGDFDSPSSRRVKVWSYRRNDGTPVSGFALKRQAVAAMQRDPNA